MTILRVPLHPLELDPAACVLDRSDQSLPQVHVEHWSARAGHPPLLWPREDRLVYVLRDVLGIRVNDDFGNRCRQPKIVGFLKGLDAGLEFHLVVGRAFIASMPGVRDLFAAPRVDQEETDPNATTSRRRKRGAVRVDVQRVLGKHPAAP